MGAESERFSLFKSVESVDFVSENIKTKDFVRVVLSVGEEYVVFPKQDDGFSVEKGVEKFRWSDDHYANCLRKVNRDGASGQPWAQFGAHKGDVIDAIPDFLKRVVRERVEFFVTQDPQWFLDVSPEQLLDLGVMDPIKVFPKNELHKKVKLDSRGARLIWSVSVADELVHRYLFAAQDQEEINNFWHIPSKSGWGLTDENMGQLTRHVYAKILQCMAKGGSKFGMHSDCSHWDMCVAFWMMIMDVELRALLQVDVTDMWIRAAINAVVCLSMSVILLSDGSMYVLGYPGVQKSGVKITGSGNSHIRRCVDKLVGCAWSVVMSDDDVSEYVNNYPEKLRKYGVVVKAFHAFGVGEDFEFCSTALGEGRMEPQNVAKMVGHLLTQAPDSSLLAQFEYETRNLPSQERWMKLISDSGWTTNLSPLPVAVARSLRQKQ